MSSLDRFDICIVGAGVIGLAAAYEIAREYRKQGLSIALLEQDASFGQHTSSRNSEVIHAGIYYAPNSLKAELCVQGKQLLYEHCIQFDIPHSRVGKLIVAKEAEIDSLERLNSNAIASGVSDLVFLDRAALKKLEPAIAADAALLSPSTGIIDSHSYMQSLLHGAQNLGVQYSPHTRVEQIAIVANGFRISCQIDERRNPQSYQFECERVINAAGLGAQSIARAIDGVSPESIPELYYCKGDYFDYKRRSPFSHLIYPLPEANTAGLGIHATIDMSSRLKFGPDTEYVEQITFEIDEDKAAAYSRQISSYFPAIKAEDLQPAYAGIRPKLAAPGESAADFVIQGSDTHGIRGLVQLFGIESPGLTASLAIAKRIAKIL